jgi:hypothetical protein
MIENIKWTFMVDWLTGDEEARDEKTAEILANAIAGKIVAVKQHKKLAKS